MAILMTMDERRTFLENRQLGIGGSDVAAIIGLDEFRSPMDIYLDKTRPVDPDSPENIHLLRGQVLEPVAADLWSAETGMKIRRMGQRLNPAFPWAVVNADRQILSGNGKSTGALEIKAPGWKGFDRAIQEGLRDEYIVQMQWALFVCGYEWGEMCAINLEHAAGPLLHFPVERNEALIAHLVERCGQFWTEHVLANDPPDPDEWRAERIELDPVPGEVVTVSDPEASRLFSTIEIVQEAKKEAEALYREASAALLAWMKQRDLGKAAIEGGGRVTRIVSKGRTSFNEKQLAAFGPLDPDAVIRFLREIDAPQHLAEQVIECKLDLDLFRSQGDDFEYVRIYPNRKGD